MEVCATAHHWGRDVPVKSAEQQSNLMVHRVQALLIRQRTMVVNALRGHLAECGIVQSLELDNVIGT